MFNDAFFNSRDLNREMQMKTISTSQKESTSDHIHHNFVESFTNVTRIEPRAVWMQIHSANLFG
jgi:hypothetical protein